MPNIHLLLFGVLIVAMLFTLVIYHQGLKEIENQVHQIRSSSVRDAERNFSGYRTVPCRLQRPLVDAQLPNVTKVALQRVGADRCMQLVVFPKIYMFPNFVRPVEARQLLNATKSLFQMHGGSLCEERKLLSTGIVGRMLRRVSAFTHIPVDHAEEAAILRCEVTQSTMTHRDPPVRQAIFVTVLQAPSIGGHIVFPQGKPNNLSVAPQKNLGVLWYNINEFGKRINAAQYAITAPRKGSLWALMFRWRTSCYEHCQPDVHNKTRKSKS